jgi:hypothetical protein
MERDRSSMHDRADEAVEEGLRRARADAAAHARRERVLFAIAAALLALLGLRGILAALAASTGATSSVPIGWTLSVVACGALLVVARRARARLDVATARVRLLELARDAADHTLGPFVVVEAAVASPGPRSPVSAALSSWARRGVAVAACIAAVTMLAYVAAPASAAKLRWRFLGSEDAPEALGLRAHVEGSGEWRVEDHSQATGARALVNAAGDPTGGPALLVATGAWTRDLRAVTRCKVAPSLPARGCGVVFRFVDERNYHAARLDAADGSLVVARVSGGREEILGKHAAPVAPGVWQELALEARADRILLSWNDSAPLQVIDGAPAVAGGVGLWAPAAGVAYFDELAVDPLPATAQAFELLPLLGRGRS